MVEEEGEEGLGCKSMAGDEKLSSASQRIDALAVAFGMGRIFVGCSQYLFGNTIDLILFMPFFSSSLGSDVF